MMHQHVNPKPVRLGDVIVERYRPGDRERIYLAPNIDYRARDRRDTIAYLTMAAVAAAPFVISAIWGSPK